MADPTQPANPVSDPLSIYPDSDEYQILGDAPADAVQGLPRPEVGRFVRVLPPRTLDGYAEALGKTQYVPVRPFLALAWPFTCQRTNESKEVWESTDGYLVMGYFKKAVWLPEGWEIGTFPAGWLMPHLEAWFEYAIFMAGLERGDLPRDAEKGPALCPAPRQLVAHAYMIVRHLRLPNSPVEPCGPMTPAGCEGQLREVLHFLRRAIQQPAETPAPPALPTPSGPWPLVGERTSRREPRSDLARDEDHERQSRYCQGFDPDWWLPAHLVAKWRTPWYPREATPEAVGQWLKRIDQVRAECLGPASMPERAVELESGRENDLALIREHAPHLPGTRTTCPRTHTDRPPQQAVEEQPPAPGADQVLEIDLEAQALALLFQQPSWSVAEIADHLKVDRKTPYKWPNFRKAAEMDGRLKPRGARGRTPRRGHKTRDGQVEAYADEDEDE
jgi:hypothetical protein